MDTLENLDKAYVYQCIDKLDEILTLNDDNTQREIQKLTETMTAEEQRYLVDSWATLFYHDADPEMLKPEKLKELFFLNKIEGE